MTTKSVSIDEDTVSQNQIEVHWQHPRHDLENPVLLVWPNPLRENWAAEIIDEDGAKVVAREILVEVDDGDGGTEIKKHTERVDLCGDTIPQYVEQALLEYTGNYGPVNRVINQTDADRTSVPNDPTITLDAYFNEVDDEHQ